MPMSKGPNANRVPNQPHPAFKQHAPTCNLDLGRQERRRLETEHRAPTQTNMLDYIYSALEESMNK